MQELMQKLMRSHRISFLDVLGLQEYAANMSRKKIKEDKMKAYGFAADCFCHRIVALQ